VRVNHDPYENNHPCICRFISKIERLVIRRKSKNGKTMTKKTENTEQEMTGIETSEKLIQEIQDLQLAEEGYARYLASGKESISIEKVAKDLGIDLELDDNLK
jgi:hypothetical protein